MLKLLRGLPPSSKLPLLSLLPIAGLGSGLLSGTDQSITSGPSMNKDNDPPNVVLIVVDDLGYADLGVMGVNDDIETPNIDKLAEQGVRFTNAYASSPISSPSRGSLLTGCYQQRWGTFWYGGPGLHDTTFTCIPELLKTHDYTTGYIGKVHYGSHDWDTTHHSFPLNHGFDYYYGHTSARKHYLNHSQQIEDEFQSVKKQHNRKGQSLRQQSLWENFNKVDTIAFSTELFGKKACEFIDQNKESRFFLQLSFNAVHNFTHQLPEEYLEKNNLKPYPDWDPSKEEYYDWYVKGRKPNNPDGRAHYLGQLYYLDREIGRVLDYLEANKLDENTIIILISDNGGSTPIYADNGHLRGSKYTLYEGGIKVPLIISYPGTIEEGAVKTNMVSAMDILPTLTELCGVNTPQHIDGIDLSTLLTTNESQIQHDTLFWDSGHEIAVRAGKWKLFISRSDYSAKYEMVELEVGEFLFDLESDPGESKDVKDEYPEVFLQLKRSFENWKKNL